MANSIGGLPPGLEALSNARLQSDDKKAKTLGQDEFLRLMVAQMNNQDPMKPMDGGQFLSQMAQFGTVTGVNDLQKSFVTLATSLQSNQALQASTMVGRQVLVAGDKLNLADGSDPVFGVELQKAASQVNVAITDSAGQVVRNFSLGQTDAGIHDLAWDGLDVQGNRLPAGQYTLKVDATIDNKVEAGTSLVRVPVESVTLPRNGQAPMLNLAEYGSLSMDAVRRVF